MASCSRGTFKKLEMWFAVLRSKQVAPLVLARLLQDDFVNAQILRDNSGIAYPTIEESRLLDLVLPVSLAAAEALGAPAAHLTRVREEASRLEREFESQIASTVSNWNEK